MSTHDTDVVIAGGGLAGATLALALGRILPSLRITVVEAFPLAGAALPEDYQPSYDARSTALAWGSRLIYERLGLWSQLAPYATPIRHIHVSDRGRFGTTRLAADEHGQEALGYVVDNRWMGLTLMAEIRSMPQIQWRAPASVTACTPVPGGVEVRLQQDDGRVDGHQAQCLQAQCLVVADGGRSGLREVLGFQVRHTNYEQHALIASVSTAQSHVFTAYERFTDAGPMALLPSGGPGRAGHESALVWTLSDEALETVLTSSADDRCRQLQQRFGWRLGRITRIGECHHYPLTLTTVDESVRPGMALVGNAAHTLHPVAGQGFNLALRGLMTLVEQFQSAVAKGTPLGDLTVLQSYQRIHRADWQKTVQFSDSLIRLFGARSPWVAAARDLGLVGLELLPGARHWFARQAMGLGRPRARMTDREGRELP